MPKIQKTPDSIWNSVFLHWYSNLMLTYAGELKLSDIANTACALCQYYSQVCSSCPIRACGISPYYNIIMTIFPYTINKGALPQIGHRRTQIPPPHPAEGK